MDADDPWQRFYDSSSAPRRGNHLLIAGGVVVSVIAVAVAVWLVVRPSESSGSTPAAPAATPAAAPPAATSSTGRPDPTSSSPPDPADRLLALLPSGYPAQACAAAPADPERGQVAVVDCARNLDPGGPASATYTLMVDPDALGAAFSAEVDGLSEVVVCPGNIQSPGPWRRADAPRPSGVLVCGMSQDRSTLAWTDDARKLLVTAQGDPTDSALGDLYAWWSGHS